MANKELALILDSLNKDCKGTADLVGKLLVEQVRLTTTVKDLTEAVRVQNRRIGTLEKGQVAND